MVNETSSCNKVLGVLGTGFAMGTFLTASLMSGLHQDDMKKLKQETLADIRKKSEIIDEKTTLFLNNSGDTLDTPSKVPLTYAVPAYLLQPVK